MTSKIIAAAVAMSSADAATVPAVGKLGLLLQIKMCRSYGAGMIIAAVSIAHPAKEGDQLLLQQLLQTLMASTSPQGQGN